MKFYFQIPIFPLRCRFYSGAGDLAEFNRKAVELEDIEPKVQGATCMPAIWVNNHDDTGLIVHELGHLAGAMARYLSIPGEEFKCYLQEYLFNRIQSRLQRKEKTT